HRLVPTLELAGGGHFSRGVLREWLTEPETFPRLCAADPRDLRAAANALTGLIAGSPSVSPSEAGGAADAVITAAVLTVLDRAPDSQTRLIAALVRSGAGHTESLADIKRMLVDIELAQNLPDDDLRWLRAQAEQAQRKAEEADRAIDVLVVEDRPF